MDKQRLLILGLPAGKKQDSALSTTSLLAHLFQKNGYKVIVHSDKSSQILWKNKLTSTINRLSNQFDIAIIESQGRDDFLMEDVASGLFQTHGKRVILNFQERDLQKLPITRTSRFEKVISRADRLIVPSTSMADAIANMGYPAIVIPKSLDLSKYPFRLRKRIRPRLLWLSPFSADSNPEMAIQVLARLKDLITDSELVMSGQDDGLLRKSQALAQELNVIDRVYFHDEFSHDDLVMESKKADILIHTSRIPEVAMYLLKGCALGMPIVACNTGGVSNILNDRETAILVEPPSIQEMVQAILEIIRDPDVAFHLSQNGRILAEVSDENRVLELWEEQFQAII